MGWFIHTGFHRLSEVLDKNIHVDYLCFCLISATVENGGPTFLGRIANWRGITSSVLALQLTS